MASIVPVEELVLDTEQCVEVSLYMYEQWQEAMKPPLYTYYDFPTWLHRLKKPITELKGNK